MYQGISLASAPPFGVVVGFFVNAQIYLICAGALILGLFGDFGFVLSSSSFIIIVHCLMIGFVLLMIFGAIAQMLPVLAGVRLAFPRIIACITLFGINAGMLCFVLAFLSGARFCFVLALIFLGLGIGTFIGNVCVKLIQIKHFTPTILYMIGSIISLVIVGICGGIMLGDYAQLWSIATHYKILDVHIGFGGIGFMFCLIIGVSLQVLPMFYVSPAFKSIVYTFIIPLFFIGIIVLLIAHFWIDSLESSIMLLCALLGIVFGYNGLKVLLARKRKLLDSSIVLWYFGLGNLIAFGLIVCGSVILEIYAPSLAHKVAMLGSVVFVLGFVFAIIYAMMYKILPFLAWFHLSYEGVFDLPNMREIIPSRLIKLHIVLYICTYLSVIASLILGRDCSMLWGVLLIGLGMLATYNALQAFRIYRVFLKKPKMKFE